MPLPRRLFNFLSIAAGIGVAGLATLAVPGCRFASHQVATTHSLVSIKAPEPQTVPLNLALGAPNEAGEVPILEYHELTPPGFRPHAYQYPLASFRADMEKLYTLGYRPINLTELVTGRITCPAGKSPVVITFDDALRGQIDYTPDGKVDPNCAVGVFEAMHAEHPDWPLKATFFVIPVKGSTDYFYQSQFSQAKLQWLAANGFELGNHTVHHLMGMKHWPDTRVESEFAVAAKMIDDNVPNYKVDLLALPFGVYPKNQKLVQQGSFQGMAYANICACLAGAGPAPSPVTKRWNPYRLPRIIPGPERYAIPYWLDYLQKHANKRYVSDGDPVMLTVPKADSGQVIPAQLQKLGLTLRTY